MKYFVYTHLQIKRVITTFICKSGEFVDKVDVYEGGHLTDTINYAHVPGGSFNSKLKPMMQVIESQLLEAGWVKIND